MATAIGYVSLGIILAFITYAGLEWHSMSQARKRWKR